MSSTSSPYVHLPQQLTNCELDVKSDTYQEAMDRTNKQVAELNELFEKVRQGGGSKAVERHYQRQKLLPRERIQKLCDPGK
jgi:3-methylcrotonyl-CoA carboxylase beta subunit